MRGLEYILDATRASKEYSIELEIFGHQNRVAHRDERTGSNTDNQTLYAEVSLLEIQNKIFGALQLQDPTGS